MVAVSRMNGHAKHPDKGDEDDEGHAEFTPPDGGWGWVVCFASFWVNGTVFGMLNTYGVLLPSISQLASGEENITTKVCKYGAP